MRCTSPFIMFARLVSVLSRSSFILEGSNPLSHFDLISHFYFGDSWTRKQVEGRGQPFCFLQTWPSVLAFVLLLLSLVHNCFIHLLYILVNIISLVHCSQTPLYVQSFCWCCIELITCFSFWKRVFLSCLFILVVICLDWLKKAF